MTCVQPARVVELSQKKSTKHYPPNSQNKVDPIQIQRSLILGVVSPDTAKFESKRIQAMCTAVCFQMSATPTTFLESSTMCLKPAPTRAASTHACSQHPRSQPAPTLAVSTYACSQTTLAGSIHVCRQHPRLQAAPTLAGSTHACSQHPRLLPP